MYEFNDTRCADLIPGHMRTSMKEYVLHGRPCGGFLTAVLENDLIGAINRADNANRLELENYMNFIYNYIPSDAWGDPATVKAYRTAGGIRGIEAAAVKAGTPAARTRRSRSVHVPDPKAFDA